MLEVEGLEADGERDAEQVVDCDDQDGVSEKCIPFLSVLVPRPGLGADLVPLEEGVLNVVDHVKTQVAEHLGAHGHRKRPCKQLVLLWDL